MRNVYEGSGYAAGYAELDWDGTYYLIKRDLPRLLKLHATTGRAFDFGCGAGRSTRLLHDLGYLVEGVDVSKAMIEEARRISPDLTFHTISDGDFSNFEAGTYDLVLACFPFDNIAGVGRKANLMRSLGKLLRPGGVFVNVVSSVNIYDREWVSFTTEAFPQNRSAQNEEIVRIVTRSFKDSPVCEDIRCDDSGYGAIYDSANLRVIDCLRPLGNGGDPVEWLSETEVSPWVLWVLTPQL